MGYYIYASGTVSFNAKDEPKIVDALKRLNYRHDLKHSGGVPKTGDVWEDKWFAWMPPRYHEDDSITTVAQILNLLGYNTERAHLPAVAWNYREGDTVLSVENDGKLGDESLFFAVMAQQGCLVDVWVTGEDETWQWRSNGEEGCPLQEWQRPQEYVCVYETVVELSALSE